MDAGNIVKTSTEVITALVGLAYTVTLYSGIKFNRHYKLIRKKQHADILIEKISKSVYKDQKDEVIIDHLPNYYAYAVMNFYRVIKTKLKHVNLSAFYKNVTSLYIKEKNPRKNYDSFATFTHTYGGSSAIVIYRGEVFESIYHELFHLASTRDFNNILYSGFSQLGLDDCSVGDALNEGYTAILAERYFQEYGETSIAYKTIKPLCAIIEMIVGREKMEKLYFDADLYGLVRSVKRYMSKDDIIIIINSLELILNYECESNKLIKGSTIRDVYKDVAYILYNALFKKLISDYEKKKTTKLQIAESLSNVIDILSVKKGEKPYRHLGFSEEENQKLQNEVNKFFRPSKNKLLSFDKV